MMKRLSLAGIIAVVTAAVMALSAGPAVALGGARTAVSQTLMSSYRQGGMMGGRRMSMSGTVILTGTGTLTGATGSYSYSMTMTGGANSSYNVTGTMTGTGSASGGGYAISGSTSGMMGGSYGSGSYSGMGMMR